MDPSDDLRQTAVRKVRESRLAQGLPPKISDPAALSRLATLLGTETGSNVSDLRAATQRQRDPTRAPRNSGRAEAHAASTPSRNVERQRPISALANYGKYGAP